MRCSNRCGPTLFQTTSRHAPFLAAALFLAACGGDGSPAGPEPEPEPSVATVEITPGADTLTALGETRSFTAVARDADGDPITGLSFTWSTSDQSVATVDDQGVVTASANGTAEITATVDGVTGSAGLAVIQQVESVTVTPSSATLTTVGATRTFTAAAVDANDNAVTGAAILWTSEDPSVATVDSAGVVTSKGAGVSTITASIQGVPGHAALTVSQEIDHLAFRTQPTSASAGEAIDPAVQVEVLDAAGNRVTDAEIAITLSLGTNPGSGTLAGTKTVSATAGVATFGGLWVDAAASGYGLAAASTGVTGATSAAFDIAPGPAAALAFVTQPGAATAGKAIDPVKVAVHDAYGNPVTGAIPDVSVSLAANPGGGTLAGTVSVAASGGVATFADLWIDRAATGYRMGANAPSLAGDISAAFSVDPGEPTRLGFVTQPSTAEGQELMPSVRVAVQDAFGNTVPSASADVVVALHSNPTGDTLSGTLAAATVDGVATFSDLSLALPSSAGYSLSASAHSLEPGQSEVFAVSLTFAELNGGLYHTCGVTVTNHGYCWGSNSRGQLGDGTTTSSQTPVPVSNPGSFAQVSTGEDHSCGLTSAGEAFCWGSNVYGQLGDATSTDRAAPAAVDVSSVPTNTFVRISAGQYHTCAITTDNEPYCWGYNAFGQLGDGTTTSRSTPVAVDASALPTSTFAWISLGGAHTCGVTTANEAVCWGHNLSGAIGDGSTTDRYTPVAVSTAESFTRTAAGLAHSCGLTSAGEVLCWGSNVQGQLGDGTTTTRTVPEAVSTTDAFVQLSLGRIHSCGVTAGARAVCWGNNGYGQLGDGTTTDRTAPVAVATTRSFAYVGLGQRHSCGVTVEGETLCWGYNLAGQLGDGTNTHRSTPVRVVQ